MIRVSIEKMRRAEHEGRRPAGYVEAALQLSNPLTATHVWFKRADYERLAKMHGDPSSLDWLARHPQTPNIFTDTEQSLIDDRKAICSGCEHKKELLKLTVKCALCHTCSGVNLLTGKCKAGKW